jgi:hypothetical protein
MGIPAAALVAALLLHAGTADATPYVPQDAATVLERLPLVLDGTRAELRRLRGAAAARPGELEPALALAERYVALGQASQDPRFMGYARAALQPWWDDPGTSAPVLVLRATIGQNRHEFAAARADLDRALALEPANPRAWAARAAILLVQGEPEAALASCAALDRTAASIAGTVCRAAAFGRLGRARTGHALLDTTLTRSAALDPRIEAWARNELAELAVLMGDTGWAERQLREALRLQPEDAATAIALADLLLDQHRPGEALAIAGDDPRHDGKLLRAALAQLALGAPAWRDQAATLEARFAAARLRGDAQHQREEARFRLTLRQDATAALRLAQANWQAQREPWDLRLLLETALAADNPGAAAPALAWLRRTGFQDPRLDPARKRLEGDGR